MAGGGGHPHTATLIAGGLLLLGVLLQGFEPWSLAALGLGLIFAVAIAAARAYRAAQRFEPRPVDGLIAALAAWFMCAAWLGAIADNAAVATFQQLPLVLAYAIARLAPPDWRRLEALVAVVAAALAVLAFLEPLFAAGAGQSVTFVQRNSLAGYLLMAAFVILPGLARSAGRAHRWAWGTALFLAAFGVFFTTSRAALAAFVVAFAGYLLGSGRAGRQRGGLLALAIVLWAFLAADLALKGDAVDALGALRAASPELALRDDIDDQAKYFDLLHGRAAEFELSTAARERLASANERFLIWNGVLRLLPHVPWHGFGPGSFGRVFPRWSLPADRSDRLYAHSDLLQIYVELGWPGLGFVVLLGLAVCGARIGLPRHAGAQRREGADAALWSVAAVAMHAVFDFDFYVPATLILVGFVLARLVDVTAVAPARRGPPPARLMRPAVAAFVGGSLVVMATWTLVAALAMTVFYERGVAALVAGDTRRAEAALTTAARFQPSAAIEVARAHLFLAAAEASDGAARRAALAEVERHLASADALDPYSAAIPYARMLRALARDAADPLRAAEIERHFAATMRRDRRFFPARLALARFLVAQGRPRAARGVLEAGLAAAFPRHVQALDYLGLLRELRARDQDETGVAAAERDLRRMRSALGMET
ncbi:MAG: O-antigen ligase family protein [Gammaproteobacteria bacterium]|nr:O-antigen ligase family protein [Gammaproteobacteria bacterium]MCP5199296.1 O-antigen ligase family protein [Gammaproteobacteria bacterium]